ncbi:MAG: polysaccharide biosynthesis C-terminal domain-containing protein [Myxococcales bacterium]|nr:polysaccharide biosynthesis C-terminal domain-containing protein [Myxococcales bacterium]
MQSAPTARAPASVGALLRLAWPIVISRSTQVVVGLSDALMVAHLGEGALAATTTGAMNAFALFILPMGTVFIVASFSSQLFGKADLPGARRYGFYGLAIALGTQALGFGLRPFLGELLSPFGFDPEVRQLLHGYLRVRLLAGGAVVGLEALANYYGGLGNTRLPMFANLAAMALNVLGNWLLIDGRFGLPRLGVIGAAWASVGSTALAFAGLFAFFLAEGRRAGGTFQRLQLAELGRTLRFGLPSGLNWFFEFLAFLFFVNVVVAGLGTNALAALMAVIQLNSASFMPAFALASSEAETWGRCCGWSPTSACSRWRSCFASGTAPGGASSWWRPGSRRWRQGPSSWAPGNTRPPQKELPAVQPLGYRGHGAERQAAALRHRRQHERSRAPPTSAGWTETG